MNDNENILKVAEEDKDWRKLYGLTIPPGVIRPNRLADVGDYNEI